VSVRPRQVFAFSGVLNRPPDEKRDPAFLEYAVSLAAGDGRKRVCFIPTATGDSPSAIEAVTEVFAGREDVDFSVLTLFTQPSVPDAGAHLTAQDVLLVGGGSVVNLMAVWRAHGLAPVMRECWEAGWFSPGGAPAACAGTAVGRPTHSATPWPCSPTALASPPRLPRVRSQRRTPGRVRHRGRRRPALHRHRTA
jgi:hypothetical protein